MAADKWTKTQDGLPLLNEEVLVAWWDGDVTLGTWDGSTFVPDPDNYRLSFAKQPTHWMEKPEAPSQAFDVTGN